ncbi:MAG: hypothetical protein ACJAS9_001276 [Polaribacter sp.]|jgi:hypothetical protein
MSPSKKELCPNNTEILNWDPVSMENYWEQCHIYDHVDTLASINIEHLSEESFQAMSSSISVNHSSKKMLLPFKRD